MPDREKVIRGLECLITNEVPCDGCPYNEGTYCLRNIANDALELLKEQEPEEDETESSVRQEDVGTIMNLIEKALRKTGYQTVGYDNTCIWLQVFIDRR